MSYFRTTPYLLQAAMLLIAALAAGCSGLLSDTRPKPVEALAPAAAPPGLRVRVGGDGFALGDIEQSSLTPQQYVERTEELVRAGRLAAAARWVQRYPDLAQTVLIDATASRVSLPVLHLIAAAHDEQVTCGTLQAGWRALVADRERDPQAYAEYDQRRSRCLALLQNGQAREALELDVLAAVPPASPAVLRIDALRLQGLGLILDERPREAAEAFLSARQTAGSDFPYASANLALLHSDALRRAGDGPGADQAWQEAAFLAADLAVSRLPLGEPILWERTAYLRPAPSPWPEHVLRQLEAACARSGLTFPSRDAPPTGLRSAGADEAVLWANIGQWRLLRDEPQAALVALKRAESQTSDRLASGRLQLLQARALLRLGQTSAATAVLVQLAGGSDPRLARPAQAVLGTARLTQGGTQQGVQLLRQAVEADPSLPWPERAEAEADLGLAHLLVGDEAAGLDWLHRAQDAFEAAAQYDALHQSLANELAYLERTDRKDQTQQTRQRLERLLAY